MKINFLNRNVKKLTVSRKKAKILKATTPFRPSEETDNSDQTEQTQTTTHKQQRSKSIKTGNKRLLTVVSSGKRLVVFLHFVSDWLSKQHVCSD